LFALAPFINLTLLDAAGEPTVNEDDWPSFHYRICSNHHQNVPLADL
jgi:hypothetical protein